jgi:polysaccharide export outer membrane protein
MRLPVLLLALVAAQPMAMPTGAQTPDPAASAAAGPAYRIGPGDVLEVTVVDRDDLSRLHPVETDGSLTLPLVGPVFVSELTVSEIERKLRNLLAGDVLPTPSVRVRVAEHNSQFATLAGEVNRPGRVALRGDTRLADALIAGGGLTPAASGEILIRRADGSFADGRGELRLRLGRLPTLRDQVNLGLPLRHGDVVTALPLYHFSVWGEVNRPGRFAVDEAGTLLGALTLAGGTTEWAGGRVTLKRKAGGGEQLLQLDLRAIREGRAEDVTLAADDYLVVEKRGF